MIETMINSFFLRVLMLILLPLLLCVSGCEINSDNTKIQYMPDMADAPSVKTQEDYLDPPDHSIPVNGILYPKTVEQSEKLLKNPFPASDKVVSDGKELFNTFCTPCHGPKAKGNNALGGKYPQPPDLTLPMYKSRGDGFFFYRITFGSAIMPGYGHAISPHERWKLIHYLRSLQN